MQADFVGGPLHGHTWLVQCAPKFLRPLPLDRSQIYALEFVADSFLVYVFWSPQQRDQLAQRFIHTVVTRGQVAALIEYWQERFEFVIEQQAAGSFGDELQQLIEPLAQCCLRILMNRRKYRRFAKVDEDDA